MSGLAVSRYDQSAGPEWDEFVPRSSTPNVLFLRDYMEYHRDRFDDFSLMVRDGSRLLACLPANRDGDIVVSHGGLTFGGVLSVPGISTRTMLEAFGALLDYLRAEGCSSLVYKPAPHIYHSAPAEQDLYALFRNEAQLVGREVSSVIRMGNRIGYSKGRRGSVKSSERHGLAVTRTRDAHGFMGLLAELLERRYRTNPVHTAEDLQELSDRFPDAIKVFTASRDAELVGGVVIYETPRVARAQYIGATEEGKQLGAVDAIIDRLLSVDYQDKAYFDLGTSVDPETGDLNLGLLWNKESYGASAIAFDRYTVALG